MASKKIIWFLVGNPEHDAGSRIHGINVHQKLLSLGYNSHIAYIPAHTEELLPLGDAERLETILSDGDIVILQKIKNPINIPLIPLFRKSGARVVLLDCDLPVSSEIGSLADQVICASRELVNAYDNIGIEASYIEDCPEKYNRRLIPRPSGKLKCYWFGDGSAEKWNDVLHLRSLIERYDLKQWELLTISNHPDADIKWFPGFWDILAEADAVALPHFNLSPAASVKSANRLLQAMALSLPVICSSHPSYGEIVRNGENAFLCKSDEEWEQAFTRMQDPMCRKNISENAYNAAVIFGMDIRIEDWIKTLSLSEDFKVSEKQHNSEAALIRRYFLRKLLSRNIHYLDGEKPGISKTYYYLKTRMGNAYKKLRKW